LEIQSFDDIADYVDAYRGSEEGEDGRYTPPTEWTDTHVGLRLIAAFDVLARTVANPGPKKIKSALLSIVREWADLVDDETKDRVLYRAKIDKRRSGRHGLIDWESYVDGPTKRLLGDDAAEDLKRCPNQATSLEIDMADEALGWSMTYLQDSPCQADALHLWAWGTAHDRNIAKVLRARCVAADKLIEYRRAELEADRRKRKLAIAREVMSWGNPRIAVAVTQAEADAIPAEMVLRMRTLIWRDGLDTPLPAITRSEVMPDVAFTRSWLDFSRKEAAKRLARALRRDRVIVR